MRGKIKFKLVKDPFFRNRNYRVSVNGEWIGDINHRHSNLDFENDFGKYMVTISGENYAKELEVQLGHSQIVKPIYISHSYTYGKKLPLVLRYFLIGLFVVITGFLVYNTITHGKNYWYLFAVILALSTVLRYNEKEFKTYKRLWI